MRELLRPESYPVAIGCMHGKDRTGLISGSCSCPRACTVGDGWWLHGCTTLTGCVVDVWQRSCWRPWASAASR